MDPLSFRLVENGVVYPTIRVASHPDKLLMGVYDESGYVADTALDRRSGEQGAPVPRELFPEVTDADAPEAIYAGPLYLHFGHFLLESLARAWYAHRHPEAPFVWAAQHTWQGMKLLPWQAEILEILGITNPTMIVAAPSRFKLLHVPDIGYRYDDWLHPEHAAFLARYEGSAQVPGHRLWLSRSKIATDVRDLNAAPSERRLAAAGWKIAHPETLSVREQLNHLGRAETVAGEEGSAFHTLLLLKDVTAKKLHIFRRHGAEHRNMHTVGDARQIDQTFHSLERQRVLRAEGRFVSKMNPNASEILDALEVPIPAAPAPAEAVDASLAQTLAELEPHFFLDLGATDAELVLGSSAPGRVAISPHFAFDPRSHADAGVEFYELGFNEYADLFHGGGKFDVIRVAGTDVSEVMSRFRASKRLARKNTTWILGSGDLAARVALAIRTTQPGFTATHVFVGRRTVYLAWRRLSEPRNDSDVATMPMPEVMRRLRWTRPATFRRLRELRAETMEGQAR